MKQRLVEWRIAVDAAQKLKGMSDEAAATARRLADLVQNHGTGERQIELPENWTFAMEVLAEVRRENRELGLLRRRELELMKKADPAKAGELASQPEQPAGRENLDKQAKEDPTMKNGRVGLAH